MILTREQVVFCRIKLKCFWPAQIKSVKKGSAVEVKFINRLDLPIQTKPETDIVSFEEGLDKAKSSTQQGIEKAIEKAQEIILSQSKVKKQSNIQASSVIRQELEHKEKNTQISRITRADTMASHVKGKIEAPKDKLRSKSIVKTGNPQTEVASKSPKQTVTQIETLKEKGMASSLSKIKAEIPKIKISIGSASSSKTLSTGVGKTSIINLPNLLNSKIAKHQIKNQVANGKRKREDLKDNTTEEEIKLQKKQKIDTPKIEKRITQNHQEVRKIIKKKDEKISEKINSKRETRSTEQKSHVFSKKISTKTTSPKKNKKMENKTKCGGSSHKKKRDNSQNSQLEEKYDGDALEVKVEEDIDVGQTLSPTKNQLKNKSKRFQETNNHEYSYMDEEEDNDKYNQESPDFGIKKGSYRYYQQDMNNNSNNGSNSNSFSSYQNSIFNNTSSTNWANNSSISSKSTSLNETQSYNCIYMNNGSNHGMQDNQSDHLPSFGNSTNSNNRGYFDASDELNFVAPAHPVEEEKCGLTVAQQRGLLYTGLKSGAISAQQFEFLSSQLEAASQMSSMHSLQSSQQQQQQQQAAQQQTQQLFGNSPNLQNNPSNLQQQRTPFGNITQSVLNNAQSNQGSQVPYFKQQQNPCDFTQNMAYPQNSTQPQHLSPTQNRDLPCFGSATFTTSSFDDSKHISSASPSPSSSNESSSSIQGSFVNCPIRIKLSQKILPMLENKAKNKVQYENEKDMWLCEVVECVRQLKSVPPQQLYEGEYSMILEQVYDMIVQIQDQTKRNLMYVLSMITRTMADLDKKVIKHLHDFPSIGTPSQVRNTTKIEDSLIHSASSCFSSIELEKSQEPKELLQPMVPLHKIEQENNQYHQYLTAAQPQSAEKMSPSQNRHNRFPEAEQESTSKKLTDNSSEQCTPSSDLANQSASETLPLAQQGNPSLSPPRKAAQIKEEEQGHFQV